MGCRGSKADGASPSHVIGRPPTAQAQGTPAIDLKRYTEPNSIWVALLTGHVRLVKMSWLIKHAKAKGILGYDLLDIFSFLSV